MPRQNDGKLVWPRDFVNQVICGDARAVLRQMPDTSVDCVVTSPPYWGIRSYPDTEQWWGGKETCQHVIGEQGYCHCGAWYGQLGLEPTWQLYVEHLQAIFREVHRVLAPHGSLWLNLGDTFLGSWGNYGARRGHQRLRHSPRLPRPGYEAAPFTAQPPQSAHGFLPKHKLGLPWRVRFALNEDGWLSRGDVVWYKPNALPSSVQDRLGTRYELLFHFVKARRYFFDLDAIREPHKTDTPKARRDLARMLTGRKVYAGKWANEPGVGRAFVGGHAQGRNPGDVWSIPTRPFNGAHFATFPEALCVRPILATCPEAACVHCGQTRVAIRDLPSWYKALLGRGSWAEQGRGRPKERAGHLSGGRSVVRPAGRIVGYKMCGCREGFRRGIVLDPFCGSGTTLAVAKALNRDFIGIDLSTEYCALAVARVIA